MRRTAIQTLVELAEKDRRILLLTADLGYTVVEPFAARFPDRFYNVGVAEQNLLGLATGLAEAGWIPYVYSIVTFASLRPFEFIRNGPVLHRLPVRILSVGGGFEYGQAGPTHHGLEDIGAMRLLPGLTVVAPADFAQARAALQATANLPGPVYVRLGKDDKNALPGLRGRFALGKAQKIREGKDLLFITLGSVAPEALAAAERLAQAHGLRAGVLVVASVQPPPRQDLARALARVPLAIAVEAHTVNGGLGSLVAEVIAESGLPCRLLRCGVRAPADGISGSEAYLLARHGLDRKSLEKLALRPGAQRKAQRP